MIGIFWHKNHQTIYKEQHRFIAVNVVFVKSYDSTVITFRGEYEHCESGLQQMLKARSRECGAGRAPRVRSGSQP